MTEPENKIGFGDAAAWEDGTARIFTSSVTTTVTTNSTLLRVVGALVGAALLSLPLYLAYATAVGSDSGGYASQHYHRRRRSSQDQGNDSFQGYEQQIRTRSLKLVNQQCNMFLKIYCVIITFQW